MSPDTCIFIARCLLVLAPALGICGIAMCAVMLWQHWTIGRDIDAAGGGK